MQHGMFRQIGQTGCISFGSLSESEDALVAGQLALDAKTAFDPPQHRIQRKQHKAQLLQQIDPIVSTTQMFHLMQNNLLQLREPIISQQERPG